MKNLILKIMAVCVSGFLVPAFAQNSPSSLDQPPNVPAASPASPGVMPAELTTNPAAGAALNEAAANAMPAEAPPDQSAAPKIWVQSAGDSSTTTNDLLRLNFQNVPLQMVLEYLSDAAGFVIIMDTPVHGNVSVISGHPMTRDQAVDLLNSVLNQNGYAAIRGGSDNQTLTIVSTSDAKTRNIPVKIGYDPAAIPNNDEIVTQIIPIRYVDASQLVSDLSSFVSPNATVVANQAGNSIVITDTQENIKHYTEIIEAIDSSAAGETDIQVFPLKYASPTDVATELGNVFPSSTSGNNQLPIRFGRFGGFGGGGFGGGGFGGGGGAGGSGSSNNERAQKQSQVTAVADGRTQSVIVTASKDLMPEIQGMIEKLDIPSSRDQKVYAYHLDNADPNQVLQVLQGIFPQPSNARNSTTTSTSDAFQSRAQGNATTVQNVQSTLSQGLNGGGGGGGRGGAVP
ncbi:MAG TPA: secretin N-terminal domain-containing protein [Verrucomicrobiae bacterium]|jgi:general secretion pathway protein D